MTLKTKLFTALAFFAIAITSCKKNNPLTPINVDTEEIVPEKIDSFSEIAMIDLGGATASEISAYDPTTKKLFVVSNDGGTKVEVVDLSAYPTVTKSRTLTYAS
ncbi:MAG: alkaline phosphatase, partial [Acinetobacter sp.]